jgi:microsomal dipeptidase-like Zn-dependent dipeptidase
MQKENNMSKVSEQLFKYAQEEKKAHEEYIKDFSGATIAHLLQGGVGKEKAALLAKEACLRDENLVKSVSRAVILEKIAQYIEAVEEENVKLQAKISTQPSEKQAEDKLPPHLDKLAKMGYSKEEIEALKDVPDKVLEKVANAAAEPWEMGRGVGPAVKQMDPLLEFILS